MSSSYTNLVDQYLYSNNDVTIQLKSYMNDHMNNNSFVPDVDTGNNQSFFSQIHTTVIQPWQTFIYLRNSNNDSFLEYFDELLFGNQSGIPYLSRLKWFRNYRKENDSGTAPLYFTPQFFKDNFWADKTREDELVYLYLSDKDTTVAGAYNFFRQENRGLEFTGTILESYTTFAAKWSELLLAGYNFQRQEHHPVYDGTYAWNRIPLSLRRKWKTGEISSTDPFLVMVNCCMGPIFKNFFATRSGDYTWPIYEAHGLNASKFYPYYFRVPGPTKTCFYFSLPAIWNALHGHNEIEGSWNLIQYILGRMTHVLRLPSYLIPEATESNQTFIPTTSNVQATIRNVDRTQRYMISYIQTLNNQLVDTSTGKIDQNLLPELGYIYHNTQLYQNQNEWIETNPTIAEQIDQVITTDHTNNRYTFRTRNLDTSIFNANITYLQTLNSNEDSNLTIQDSFLKTPLETTYNIFSTGMINDPRIIQNQIYGDPNATNLSFNACLQNAQEYIVNQAPTSDEIRTYLSEFFFGAVPQTISINDAVVNTTGSVIRTNFYNNTVKEYLESQLRNKLQSQLNTLGSLSYQWEIRKLNYLEQNTIQTDNSQTGDMLDTLATLTPTDPVALKSIQAIQNRHTTSLGMNTSAVYDKASTQTPFHYYQVSPNLCQSSYNYVETPIIHRLEYDWNDTPVLPAAFSTETSIVVGMTSSRRYERTGYSPDNIRRPITYGDMVELTKFHAENKPAYWAVGRPIPIVGNYGRNYIEENYPTPQTTTNSNLPQIIIDQQDTVKSSLLQSYLTEQKNLETVSSVLPKSINIPMIDLLSNDNEKIIPRVITGDTFLELTVELEQYSNFTTEWSSSRRKQEEYLALETGNYYIRDQHLRPGLSELELKDPSSQNFELTYIRNYINTLNHEVALDGYSLSSFPSLDNDSRNNRRTMYEIWCGTPLVVNHSEFQVPEFINDITERVILFDSLPSYSRYKARPQIRRFTEANQIELDRALVPHFNYYGFTFSPEFNKKLYDSQAFNKKFKQIKSIDNIQILKQKESVKIDTIKQVFDIRFDASLGTDITIARGIDDVPKRIMYIEGNPMKYKNNRSDYQYHYQRYLDGGGLWLGTDNIATRYQQFGKDPFNIKGIEIPQEITQSVLDNVPQYDTNFRLSSEINFPVLVEYPKYWKDLHGSVIQQDSIAPHINTIERPCVIWSANFKDSIERYSLHIFKSIIFDVSGDEIGPEANEEYYHSRFSYEHFDRVTEPNLYGLQFGLGYWDKQPLGYLDFGATTNTNDRFFRFTTDQRVSQINTNLEKSVTINFDLTWQNILYARDGLLYTRYLR